MGYRMTRKADATVRLRRLADDLSGDLGEPSRWDAYEAADTWLDMNAALLVGWSSDAAQALIRYRESFHGRGRKCNLKKVHGCEPCRLLARVEEILPPGTAPAVSGVAASNERRQA